MWQVRCQGHHRALEEPWSIAFALLVFAQVSHACHSCCRVIIGKSYYEPYEVAPELPVEAALALILHLKMPRHREGLLGTAEFPVNYFTIAEVEQWYPEDFAATFLHITGKELQDGQDFFW